MLKATGFICLAAIAVFGRAALADETVVAPAATLSVAPGLDADKEAENVSGAACHTDDGAIRSCILVDDETRHARAFSINGNSLVPGGKIFLLPKDGAFDEADAEGAAYDNGSYYIVGSHGLNKKSVRQPSRYFIYRFSAKTLESAQGDLGSKSHVSDAIQRSSVVDGLLQAEAAPDFLKIANNVIPDNGGTNIEGIAVASGRLYVGFRSPQIDVKAIIGEIPAAALFEKFEGSLSLHPVDLGAGRGIRDLASLGDDLLILSGPAKDGSGIARIALWSLDGGLRQLAQISQAGPSHGQPEALAVLERTKTSIKVLIMSDGPANGDPAIYSLAMPEK